MGLLTKGEPHGCGPKSEGTAWVCSPRESRMEVPSSSDSRGINGSDMTRRELMEVAVGAGGAIVEGQLMPGFIPEAAAQAAAPSAPLNLVLRINGTEHRLALDPRTTL